ncbi:MAG: hypothetical protein KJO07_13320 [Deltaproteobacteria bacterium]|nr:hypothetical protein [Deltaproteobacteria bacterium]
MLSSLALLAALGCGSDDECGPAGDETGIELSAGGSTARFTELTASANNDCPNVGSPTAVTVAGSQDLGTGSIILCISRPERIAGSEELSFDGDVQVVSFSAELDCPTVIDRTQPLDDLQARFTGFCGDGIDPAGFGLELSGELTMTAQCEPDQSVTVLFSGSAVVEPE